MALNTHNIECLVRSLVDRDYHPLVVLHRYHLRHLRKDGSDSLGVLEVSLYCCYLYVLFFLLYSDFFPLLGNDDYFSLNKTYIPSILFIQ